MSPVALRPLRSLTGETRAKPNPFGLGVGLTGLVVGWLIATLAVNLWPHSGPSNKAPSLFAQNLINLTGLWIGLVGAVLSARSLYRAAGVTQAPTKGGFLRQLCSDYGISIRAIDVPVGIVVGLAGQYVLTPIFELPLLPFVSHLYSRLNAPANSLTKGITGVHFVILGLFVCLGSPLVEELYFRGLILRSLLGQSERLLSRNRLRLLAVALPIVVSGVFFGLVHFEPLELLALAGFGMVLGLLAWGTGRLGPGVIAHITFNTATFVALARTH